MPPREHRLELHVTLMPPGHTDLGYYTVFPHCPFCKAEASIDRWKRKYPAELQHTCNVCGTTFSPAKTSRSMRDDWDGDGLCDAMGPHAFAAFAKFYLVRHGVQPDLAEHIVVTTQAKEEEQRRKAEADRARDIRQEKYVAEILFANLHPAPADLREDDDSPADRGDKSATPHLKAEEFAELLRRCAVNRIKVSTMHHRSSDGERDKWEWRNLDRPAVLLSKWLASRRMRRWFGALFVVPATSCCRQKTNRDTAILPHNVDLEIKNPRRGTSWVPGNFIEVLAELLAMRNEAQLT